MSTNNDAAAKPKPSFGEIMSKAGSRALGGGLAGASAMVCQVSALMWLRTTMNYQYRHGTSTMHALKHLYNDGGVIRFYRGYFPALLQGPLSRFGDTAANAGMLTLWDSMESTKDLPVFLKTMSASLAAASWRICLMPIDTTKTIMQVEGVKGFPSLVQKVKTNGPRVLYHGSLATASATYVGHFPWFFTFNFLQEKIPQQNTELRKLGRNAICGFSASVISDTCSNSIRVIKTTKQTSVNAISYPEAVREVLAKDGYVGLFGRGLKTRILANGVQGVMFAVLWKYFERVIQSNK
mmetsp:Transcript_8230/g.30412  ORF Transcript_8230/g.30412 Transcript_8230/m.30412 type:complete len:295 (-) Transcript_8230:222-1106(-)|eukprot:CAMPEP_0117445472 /NCGR_PEP_ID=MMETSP0759-20121206/5814_1 /TAXON_ID=63605 /ORGANISM="Percolomonas cosmopolitus, Strain WS" /LENGTH=294 /DNA_ID=CAMNT_0005237651 /DNA_START=89 /DNA_END=973 /DNA_ORIENTATION=+